MSTIRRAALALTVAVVALVPPLASGAAAGPKPAAGVTAEPTVTPRAVPYDAPQDKRTAKIVTVSERRLTAAITEQTTYTRCFNSATSGEMRFYVTWLRDTTPNPDKLRPTYFVLQNGFGNTVGVQSIHHFRQAGVQNWWTNQDGFVLTTPHSSGSQQAGNFYQPASGNTTSTSKGALPARASGNQGSKWTVHRPQWNGFATGYPGNSDPNRVETFSPYNDPWWSDLRNDGPYFLAYYHVNGTYSTCAGWYPP